jgi:hypothetical protein
MVQNTSVGNEKCKESSHDRFWAVVCYAGIDGNPGMEQQTQYTWDVKKGLCSRAGGRVIVKTIEKQGKVDANKKKAGSSAGVRGSRRKR